MLGFLIWIPTVYFLPQSLFILSIIYVFLFRRRLIVSRFKLKYIKLALVIISLIIILSLLNYLLSLDKVKNLKNIIVPNFAYIFTFFIAIALTKKDLKVLVYLLFLEVIFIYIEFFLGINTIYFWQEDFKKINIHNLTYLYLFRPHGLSSGSSTMGYKLLVLLILYDYLTLKNFYYKLMKILSIVALILVFNRTSLVAYFSYILLKYLFRSYKKKMILARLIFLIILTLSLLIIFNYFGITDIILSQFNRGKHGVDLSYRDIIWKEQFEFIKSHLLVGNHSFKYLVPLEVYGPNVFEHAHNSFIEVLSTNGVIIFILYVLMLFIYINKRNWLYIFPFLILSLYQYAIFWGISFVDIIFINILLNINKFYGYYGYINFFGKEKPI